MLIIHYYLREQKFLHSIREMSYSNHSSWMPIFDYEICQHTRFAQAYLSYQIIDGGDASHK